MRPSRSANMASASGDEMIITTGVIVSTIHCLTLPIAIGPHPPQAAVPLKRPRLCSATEHSPRLQPVTPCTHSLAPIGHAERAVWHWRCKIACCLLADARLSALVTLPAHPSKAAIQQPGHQRSCLHRRQQQLRNAVDKASVKPERIRPMHCVMSRSGHIAWQDSRCQQDGTCVQRA